MKNLEWAYNAEILSMKFRTGLLQKSGPAVCLVIEPSGIGSSSVFMSAVNL